MPTRWYAIEDDGLKEKQIIRLRPQNADDDSHDLIGFPSVWMEEDDAYKWASSCDVTERIQPVVVREDDYIYVPYAEWVKRFGTDTP